MSLLIEHLLLILVDPKDPRLTWFDNIEFEVCMKDLSLLLSSLIISVLVRDPKAFVCKSLVFKQFANEHPVYSNALATTEIDY